MDRRGENLVRPLLLAVGLHVVLLSTFFVAVSPEAKTITPPPVIVLQATELSFAPSAAAEAAAKKRKACLLYTSPSPRDRQKSRMPSSA